MSSEIDEMNESHKDPNPLSDLDQESSRNQSVKSTDDIPQLEYDECDIQLIADRGKFSLHSIRLTCFL